MSIQSKKKLPVKSEDFYKLKEVHDAQISPDGKHVAYTYQEVDKFSNRYAKSIWIVRTDKGKPRKFTAPSAKNDFSPKWSPDGKKVAFLSNRTGNVQLWTINLDGGEAECCSDLVNGIEGFSWSMDGKFIALVSPMNSMESEEFINPRKKRIPVDELSLKHKKELAEKEEESKIDPRVINRVLYKEGTIYRDDKRNHIFVRTMKTGKIRKITQNDMDYGIPSWSPNNQYLYSFANFTGDEDNNMNTDIVQIEVASGAEITITNDENANTAPQVTEDGKWCMFMSVPAERASSCNTSIKAIELGKSDPGPCQDLTEGLDREVQQFYVVDDSRTVYYTVADRGSINVFKFDMNSGKKQHITDEKQIIEEFHVNKSGSGFTYIVSRPDVNLDIFCVDLKSNKIKRLTDINRGFMARKFISIPEEISWKADDGLELQGWIMKPENFSKNKKYPLIVEIHGGPHVMWGYSFWFEFQIMVSKGYVVFFSNPRGSDGYGKKFKQKIFLNWGVEDSRDILSGVEYVINQGFIDREQLFVTGGSYGGFMTAWIIGHDNRFKAAVAQRGVYNLTSFYGCSDAFIIVEWEFDTFPWDNPELLWKHSPLAYVTSIDTPLLIIHSDLDYRAPINNAEELFVALKKLKKEVQFIRYPREGHELSRSGEPKHRVDRLNRIVDWFDPHLIKNHE